MNESALTEQSTVRQMKLYGQCSQLPHEKRDDRLRGLKQVHTEKATVPFPGDPGSLAIPSQRNDE